MSDIDDIKGIKKITSQMSQQVSYMSGRLDTVLPTLATKEDLAKQESKFVTRDDMASQVAKCRDSFSPTKPQSPRSRNMKIITALVGALAALSASLWALAEVLTTAP